MKKNKPLLVVGTPGRLAELSRAGALHTHTTGMLVLDEVWDKFLFILPSVCPARHAPSCSMSPLCWLA
jgi:hypothetical protein